MVKKEEKSINELQERGNNINEIISKMIELEKEKHEANPIKILVCGVVGICVVMFAGLLCYRLLRADLSVESILSTLLAFFSIFLSIFFYFKADETSRDFYAKSYDIMKEVSVVLGRIEERFGEKLNSLSEKISHLDNISSEKSEEIQEQKDDKDKIINELMDKANLDEKEKENYKNQLAESERQIEQLREQEYAAKMEANGLRERMKKLTGRDDCWEPNDKVLIALLNSGIKDFSEDMILALVKLGYLDRKGNINKERIIRELNKKTINNRRV